MTLQWGDYRAASHGKDPDGSGTAGPPSCGGNSADVLSFDGHYIHCGQPMARFGADTYFMHGILDDRQLPEALGVYLATRVLRCGCGFQMEIPDQP